MASLVRIGVTGHRVLADTSRVKAGIEEALRRIETASPGSPIVVVSPLAEGADRLVAGCVLDRRPEARLVAVLPMFADAYAKDFASPESRAEFEQLLGRATCCIELPTAPTRGESYETAGVAVLDQSDVLIAVWDGKKGQGRGGTAGVVRLARERGVPIAWVHAGNRNPHTTEPTSLGAEQGRVTFENFEAVGPAAPAGKADPPDSDLMPALPYRIRIGVVAAGGVESTDGMREAIDSLLPGAILGLFDAQSRKQLAEARYTPIAYSVLARPGVEAERSLADEVHRILAADVEGAIPQEQPARVGRFIVNHCDVLILVEPPGTIGVAADSVRALAERKQRPIIHVQPGSPSRIRVTRGNGLNAKSITRLDTFNGYSPGRKQVESYVENVCKDLFSSAEGSTLPEENRELVRKDLLPYYAKASYLAKKHQRVYRRAGSLVWLLFPLAIAAVAVGIQMPSWSMAAFGIEFLLLTIIAAVVIHADRRRSLRSWIETRFLTERVRCAAFLAACGCEASALRVPPYMGDVEQRDQWMVLAFNEIWSRLSGRKARIDVSCETIRDFAGMAWVGDQIKYHENKAGDCERMGMRLERWGTAVFLLAMVAAATHMVVSRQGHHETPFISALTFAAIILPAVGAALGGFRSHREYSRLGKRSRNMAVELRKVQERLDDAESVEEIRRVLAEAEEMMLGETQDWLMLMKFVPVQYPG
jgi:hypothetical protein